MLGDLFEKISSYNPNFSSEQQEDVLRAFLYAKDAHNGQYRKSGEAYIEHPLAVAHLLTTLEVDIPSIMAAMLHDVVEDTDSTIDQIQEEFGLEVWALVKGMTKLDTLQYEGQERQKQNLQKMLLSISGDIRIVFIKLADRLHNMQTLKSLGDRPDKQVRIARETLDIYVPLADRLGIFAFKSELSDLCFRYLHPQEYTLLSSQIGIGKKTQERRLISYKRQLQDILTKESIPVEKITYRIKNMYSIYQKMSQKHKTLEEVYDHFAMRVIVPTVKDCYHTLGLVHQYFYPLDHRFKDFIATPKANGYRSIHTTIDIEWKLVEIQIRTAKMDREAQFGAAAHWAYTEWGKQSVKLSESQKKWAQDLSNVQQLISEEHGNLSSVKYDLLSDRIFVKTPKGDIKDLPVDASPLDFAYAIHTEVGNKYSGAKVNGRMVSLSYELHNNDVVEILTSPHAFPNAQWLSHAKSSLTRRWIRLFLKEQRKEEKIEEGKRYLEKELLRFNKELPSKDTRVDDVAVRLAEGDIKIFAAIKELFPDLAVFRAESRKKKIETNAIHHDISSIRVNGVEDIMVHTKNCCQPYTTDSIVGFVSKGSGVVIHTLDCPVIKRVDPKRLIDVHWSDDGIGWYDIELDILIDNTLWAGRDIFDVFGKRKINIVSFDTLKHTPKTLQKTKQEQADITTVSSVRIAFTLKTIANLSAVIDDLEEKEHILFVAVH